MVCLMYWSSLLNLLVVGTRDGAIRLCIYEHDEGTAPGSPVRYATCIVCLFGFLLHSTR